MWLYEKRLQHPVRITQTNPRLAQVIISQFGGPDGELSASMRYLAQRYTMPYNEVTGILTDIGTEETVRVRYQRIFSLGRRGYSLSSNAGTHPSPYLFLDSFRYSARFSISFSRQFLSLTDISR